MTLSIRLPLAVILAVLYVGCEARLRVESKPSEDPGSKLTPIVPVQAKVVTPISTSDMLACDRRARVYDFNKKEPEPEKPKVPTAANLTVGEAGYVSAVYSIKDLMYINGDSDVWPKRQNENSIRIERVEDGFSVDCSNLFIVKGLDVLAGEMIPIVAKLGKP